MNFVYLKYFSVSYLVSYAIVFAVCKCLGYLSTFCDYSHALCKLPICVVAPGHFLFYILVNIHSMEYLMTFKSFVFLQLQYVDQCFVFYAILYLSSSVLVFK